VTTPAGRPVNFAGGKARVVSQAENAYFDIGTITLPGSQLIISQSATPKDKYRTGVENLRSGNPRAARDLIWEAMIDGWVSNEVLFHWLIAMLSRRTILEFTTSEITQLKSSRPRYTENGDVWADGVRLVYRLLDSALPSFAEEAGWTATAADMELLIEQVDDLDEKQRDMIWPHLELLLRGELVNKVWERDIQDAQSRRFTGNRCGRAWMYFHPVPAKVTLPLPPAESISQADRFIMQVSGGLAAAATGYLGWELLRHSDFPWLLGYVIVLAISLMVVDSELDRRFLADRKRQQEEWSQASGQPPMNPSGNRLADQVGKLLIYYLKKCTPETMEYERWAAISAGFCKLCRSEILSICQENGVTASGVTWLIRFQVRQWSDHWQTGAPYRYYPTSLPSPDREVPRREILGVPILAGILLAVILPAQPTFCLIPLAITMISISAGWLPWLRINLERQRHAADSEDRTWRQAAIDEEFTRWSVRLKARPEDAEMAAWLECDRTVLLGMTLDLFQLPRSWLTAYAFIEKRHPGARRAQIQNGPWRHAGYQLRIFLLAEDGARYVRAYLDFLTGKLSINERTSYRYDAIVSVHVSRKPGQGKHTFELRLTSGDPITVHVQDVEPDESQLDQDATLMGEPVEEAQEAAETAEAEETATSDMASLTGLMHMLEGVAGEGRSWIQRRDCRGARSGDAPTVSAQESARTGT